MSNSKTASRYAKATLELSIEKGNLDATYDNMKSLFATIQHSSDLQTLIKNPVVKEEDKTKVFTVLFGDSFQPLTMDLIIFLINNKREGILSEVATQFINQYKSHKNIVTAEVIAATQLDSTQKEKILNLLKHDGEVELVEKIDASILGGFIVRVGDKQIDASIATKFKNLRKEISLN